MTIAAVAGVRLCPVLCPGGVLHLLVLLAGRPGGGGVAECLGPTTRISDGAGVGESVGIIVRVNF